MCFRHFSVAVVKKKHRQMLMKLHILSTSTIGAAFGGGGGGLGGLSPPNILLGPKWSLRSVLRYEIFFCIFLAVLRGQLMYFCHLLAAALCVHCH